MNVKVNRVAGVAALSMALAAVSGCGKSADTTPPADAAGAETATVRFVEVETGCWALETAQGRVQPIDLPEAFRKDGLEVSVVLRDAPDMMSACQIGPMKHVEHIEEKR